MLVSGPGAGQHAPYTDRCHQNLRDFWKKHPDAKAPLEAWVDEVRHATWKDAHDIKAKYRN